LVIPIAPRFGDPLFGQAGVGRIHFDTQPIPTELLSDHADGSGSEERIENQAWPPTHPASTTGLQLARLRQEPMPPSWLALPRLTAVGAHPLGARGQQGALNQPWGKRGVVCSAVVACGESPYVAGVLAEGMADQPHGFHPG
jgi:hypothetical protein